MTTPTTPDEPDEAPTAQQQPVEEQPQQSPPQALPLQGLPLQGPPPYSAPYAYPFAPRVREPWVNPAKRGVFSLVAVIVAIVLLGGGFAVGAAAVHQHDGNHSVQMRPFQGGQPGFRAPQNRQNGQRPGFKPGTGRLPRPGIRQATPTAATPAPSSSHS
jgi:hypothetical protein